MRYLPSSDPDRPYQYPVEIDHRPAASIPITHEAPPIGGDDDDPRWRGAFLIDDLDHIGEIARLTGVNRGLDAMTVATIGKGLGLWTSPQPTIRTRVKLLFEKSTYAGSVLRFRFRCDEPDMARVRAQEGELLSADYVSIIIDISGLYERPVEWIVNAKGQMFRVGHFRFRDRYVPEAPALQWSQPAADTGADPGAFEADHPRGKLAEPRVSVTHDDAGWTVDGELRLSMFGEPVNDSGVFPANITRTRQVCPMGIVQGMRYHIDRYSWSPTYRDTIEAGRFGFIAHGEMNEGALDTAITTLDRDLDEAKRTRRLYDRRKQNDADAAWRKQIEQGDSVDTQWRPHAVKGFERIQRGFTLNNGRQIITLEDGRRLILAEDQKQLALVTAEALDACETRSGETSVLIEGRMISHASMLLHDGRLHVVCAADGEVRTMQCDWPAGAWREDRIDVPAGVLPYDIEVIDGDIAIVLAGGDESVWLARGDTKPTTLDTTGRCPVLARSATGGAHLAYERVGEIFYRRIEAGGSLADETRAAFNIAFYPVMVEVDGRPLIVFQFDGLDRQRQHHDYYITDRERCASGVGFARQMTDGTWQRGSVYFPKEIVLRRLFVGAYNLTDWKRPFNGRAFAALDECWRPSIAVDAQSAVWAAWQNTTRQHAFAARFTGDGFTVPRELAGPLPGPTAQISLEKHAPIQAEDLPYIFVAEQRLLAGAARLGAIDPDRRPDVMFLDEQEIAGAEGVELVYHHPKKQGTEPVFIGNEGGQYNCLWSANVRQTADSRYVMRFKHDDQQRSGWTTGFAESDDGLTWQFTEEDLFANVPTGVEDLLETDPAKRFKKLTIEGGPWHEPTDRRVHYSPDGIHWEPGPLARNADGVIEGATPNFYDPLDRPERRFKMYGRTTTPQGRSCAMQWSGDFVDWQGLATPVVWDTPFTRVEGRKGYTTEGKLGRTFLDPSAADGEDEIYFPKVWLQGGYYLCAYTAYPFDARYCNTLAVSRDGFHWQRVLPGQYWLPFGAAGEWDSGAHSGSMVYAIDASTGDGPVVTDDGIRFYYGAGGWHHGSDPYRRQYIGMCTIEPGRFTAYQLRRECERGSLTTTPIAPDALMGRTLHVNVSGVNRRGGRLRVAVCDAVTSSPIKGAHLEDADGIDDGLKSKARWRGRSLAQLAIDRPVRLKFQLEGVDLKLFGFGFKSAST